MKKYICKSTSQIKVKLLCAGTLLSGEFALISLLLFTIPEWRLFAFITVFGLIFVFLVLLFFYIAEINNCSLRFLKLGEKYKRQTADALTHFASCDDKFRAELKRECKRTYRAFGNVLQYGEDSDNSFSRDSERLSVLREMTDDLIACIDDGSGWEGFIRFCDEERYTYRHRGIDGAIIDSPLDGWQIVNILSSELFGNTWRYFAEKVYDVCDFTLEDTHISPEYTESCNKARTLFSSSYSPALATFRDELTELSQRISSTCTDE